MCTALGRRVEHITIFFFLFLNLLDFFKKNTNPSSHSLLSSHSLHTPFQSSESISMAAADCKATGSGTGVCPYCMYWLFGSLFSLDVYLAQPRYSREGLGPFYKAMCISTIFKAQALHINETWERGPGITESWKELASAWPQEAGACV